MSVWSRIHHPNVLPLLGFYLSDDLLTASLISPWAAEGDLPNWLALRKPDLKRRLRVVRKRVPKPGQQLLNHL